MQIEIPELNAISEKLDIIIRLLQGTEPEEAHKHFTRGILGTAPNVSGVLNAEQLAVYIGVSKSTIHKYTSSRVLPFMKVGGRLLFRIEDVDEWIRSRSTRPVE